MQDLFYKVELSTGKSFNAVKVGAMLNRDLVDIKHVYAEVPMSAIKSTEVLELIDGEITSVKFKTYQQASPSDYISPPILKEEIEYINFGDTPSVESTKEGNYKIKFFEISEASKAQSQLSHDLIEATEAIGDMYMNLV